MVFKYEFEINQQILENYSERNKVNILQTLHKLFGERT